MWIEKLEEIRKIDASFGNETNDGATEKEINIFLNEIKGSFDIEKLSPYAEVLRRVNGVEFNGFILYGIDENLLENAPKQTINGFIDNNEVWHEDDWGTEYIFFGDSSISWYVYDLNKDKYYELDKPSGDVIEEFNNINNMINKMFEDALM